MKATTWTKSEFNQEVETLYKDMKYHGWTKTQAKKDVQQLMKDNNITIKG